VTETADLANQRLRRNADLVERVRAQMSWVGIALVAVLWVVYLFFTTRNLEIGLILAAGTLNSLVPALLTVVPRLRQLPPRLREAAATGSSIMNLLLVAAAVPLVPLSAAGIVYALFLLIVLLPRVERGALSTAVVAGVAVVAYGVVTGLQSAGDIARLLILVVAGAAAVRTAIGRRSSRDAVDSTARLAEILSRPSLPEEVVSATLDEIRQVVRSDNASVMLIEGDEFRIAAAAGSSGPTGAPRLALGQGVAGLVARTGQPAIVHDTERDPRFAVRTGLPVRSLICVPLVAEERVLGVVNMSSARPYAFQHEDLEAATRVGRMAGHALQAARRQRENEVRAATLAAVVRFGAQLVDETSVEGVCNVAVRTIADQGPFKRVAIYLAEGGRLLLQAANAPSAPVLNLTAGVGARAYRDRRAVRVVALGDDPEELAAPGTERVSRLAVPLEWSGQVLGVIEMDRARGVFTRLDEEVFGVMAIEIAAAVRSARAVQGERDRTAHLLAVISTLKEVNAELDLDDLLHRIVDRAIAAVSGAEAGSLVVREGNHFEFRAAVGFDLHALRQSRLPLVGPTGQPMRPGETQHVVGPIHQRWPPLDAESQAVLERYGRLDEIQASILVPIYVDGEIYGRLNLNSFTRRDAFEKVDEDLIRLFSEQAGVAIKNASLHSELQRMALADPLTGLPNRRLFDAEFSRLLAQARRSGSPLAMLVMDMDNFKRVNDELGHDIGDKALAIVAGAMRGTLRRSDLFARYGGEEFLAALPDADKEGAEKAAQTMKAAVAEARLDEHPGVRFSVSVGAACYPEDGETFQALYRVADAAMFETKSLNKGRAAVKSRTWRP
jgi:diguanylate cyclase (GGDEF)-like protein